MAYSAGGALLGGAFAGPPGAMIGGIAGKIINHIKIEINKNIWKILIIDNN